MISETETAVPSSFVEPANLGPGNACPVNPALVLVCGDISAREFGAIQLGVEKRLGGQIPRGCVQWGRLESEDKVTPDEIRKLAAPLLTLKFWDDLVAGGYLPDVPKPLVLQVLVVCDLGADERAASRLLQTLAETLRQVLGNAQSSPMLVALGGGKVDWGGEESPYWPRLRLQVETYCGAVTERSRVLEVAQTIIVASVTSDLASVLDRELNSKMKVVEWIWMGASALIVDLDGMKEYLRRRVLHNLIHPVLAEPLTFADRQALAEESEKQAGRLHEMLEGEAARAMAGEAGQFKRDVFADESGPRLVRAVRKMLRQFAQTLSEAWAAISDLEDDTETASQSGEANGQPSESFVLKDEFKKLYLVRPNEKRLARALTRCYIAAQYNLFTRLGGMGEAENNRPARKSYLRLFGYFFRALLSRELESKGADDESPGQLRRDYSVGLPSAVQAMECTIERLKNLKESSAGSVLTGLEPYPIESGDYLAAVAEADTEAVCGYFRRYRRLRRTVMSPLGVLLKLLPAWPLATGILIFATHWEEWRAALAAALGLVLMGIVETVYWRIWIRQRYREFRSQSEARVIESLLRLIPTVLQDYRLHIVRLLNDILFALRRLRPELERMDAKLQREMARLEARYEVPDLDTTIYWLADLEECSQAAERASRTANPSHRVGYMAACITDKVFPGPLTRPCPGAYYRILRDAERIADQFVQDSPASVFDENLDQTERPKGQSSEWNTLRNAAQPYAMLHEPEPLRGGKKWDWLYWRAHPLGASQDSSPQSLTIITLADEAATRGDAGKPLREKFEQGAWLMARSRHPREIICLRGIVQAA